MTLHREGLHTRAAQIASRLVARYGGELPPDVHTTVSYYLSCARGYDHAAEQLIAFASTVSVAENE